LLVRLLVQTDCFPIPNNQLQLGIISPVSSVTLALSDA